jgi:hypothetical protein
MIDPKTFYRELDELLATIRIEKSGKNLLTFLMSELENRFGQSHQIFNGHIYERRGDKYVLVHPPARERYFELTQIPAADIAISLVQKHRSYIYDHSDQAKVFERRKERDYGVPAAIMIHSPEKQWLFVFRLGEGWIREEVSLFLNAVRMSINYRLFSEIIGGRLEQAVQIQRSLLPREALGVKGYQIYGRSQPAELVGGDLYDYFDYQEGNFGVCIGDASGHGLPAALLVRDVVIGLRMGLAKEMRLVHTLHKLNEVIQRSTYSTNFVSLFVGEFESDGHLFFVNAGHPAPFLIAEKSVERLEATGIVLGFVPDIKLRRSYVHMDPGSVLVLYSDGIVERQNGEGEQFDSDRLCRLVAENRQNSAKDINNLIFDTVFEFGNARSWEDDATVVVIKRSG